MAFDIPFMIVTAFALHAALHLAHQVARFETRHAGRTRPIAFAPLSVSLFLPNLAWPCGSGGSKKD